MTNKLDDLVVYNKIKDKVTHYKALIDNREIELETFIRTISTLLGSD